MDIGLRRVYEEARRDEGVRILVDRLWPRGLRRDTAAIDHWWKELAPSDELRRWFGHDPARWDEFRRRYATELGTRKDALEAAKKDVAGVTHLTLLFAARDETHNNAVVLRDYLHKIWKR